MSSLISSLTYQPVELNFGTSGLRGLVSDMTDLECYINTRGFIDFLETHESLTDQATIYVAGDLRDSTPRILRAVIQAVVDKNHRVVYCGLIPTPAIALFALTHSAPAIMVTGSHIPANRNGIKFYKADGEVLKNDEDSIKASVTRTRREIYEVEAGLSSFTFDGDLKSRLELPLVNHEAEQLYRQRYLDLFDHKPLQGKTVVFYQHSAVGRDMLADFLEELGAEVIREGRSEVFIPIDTENVTEDDQQYFKSLADKHSNLFAIVSTEGDSDRPFVVDEHGIFHRGDELGTIVAYWFKADFAATPISSSDAVDQFLKEHTIESTHTRVGSPYVIDAMNQAVRLGKQRVVGWEVNGGFLTGSSIDIYGRPLSPLPTRDAFLPILIALIAAIENNQSVSELFKILPKRFTQAGILDDFPTKTSKLIIDTIKEHPDTAKAVLERNFKTDVGFSAIQNINTIDGVRVFFVNGDIAHLRPSGNAPQLRIYSVADTQERANEIVRYAIKEPDGILRQLASEIIRKNIEA